jgi:uroporphyrinogen-III decarboxylase
MSVVTCLSCSRDDAEDLPASLLAELGVEPRAAHTNAVAMARVSMARAGKVADPICRVPFCVTAEAEAFGGAITIPDDGSAPGSSQFVFERIEQLADLAPMDLSRGRIAEVLQSIAILKSEGKTVCLNVEGPFTVLSFLIDSSAVFSGIITRRQLLDQALQIIEASLAAYIRVAFAQGADMVSYADPTGAMQFFGPKLYREVVGASSHRLLKMLEKNDEIGLIHLCGQKSRDLEKAGFCVAKPVEVAGAASYGQSLCLIAGSKKPVLLGHNCMKNTGLAQKKALVWQLELG